MPRIHTRYRPLVANTAEKCGTTLFAWYGFCPWPYDSWFQIEGDVAAVVWIAVCLLSGWLGHGEVDAEDPQFFIEAIEIERPVYVSRQLIATQARLKPGRAYSQRELSAAVLRVQRLPFIRQAHMRLAKGSVKKQYKLIIEVEAAGLLFFNGEGERRLGEAGVTQNQGAASVGLRYFTGSHGLAYLSWSPRTPWQDESRGNYERFLAGFSHFNFMNRGGFFQLEASHSQRGDTAGNVGFFKVKQDHRPLQSYRLAMGLPLGSNQWLRFSADQWQSETAVTAESLEGFPGSRNYVERRRSGTAALFWEWNSLDDSWMPTAGSYLRAGPQWSRNRFEEDFNSSYFNQQRDWDTWQVAVAGQYLHPLPKRQSLGISADFQWKSTAELRNGEPFVDMAARQAEVRGQWLWQLIPAWRQNRAGALFLSARAGWRQLDTDLQTQTASSFQIDAHNQRSFADVSLAYRNSLAVIKFTLQVYRESGDAGFGGGELTP